MQKQSPLLILGGDQWSPQRRSPQRGSTVNFHFHMQRQSPLLILGGLMITSEAIASERINSQLSLLHAKAIASVDPGGVNNCLREDQQSTFTWNGDYLCWSLGHQWLCQRGSTVNCIMGISWCIMGNLLSSTTELQANSICTCCVKSGIYCEIWDTWDLCAPRTFRAKHGLATSNIHGRDAWKCIVNPELKFQNPFER